ncbi:hypothetical protein EON82_13675 [bacterium]|nr:MAG: hypothetical protein EON82_13675 [bacterium]
MFTKASPARVLAVTIATSLSHLAGCSREEVIPECAALLRAESDCFHRLDAGPPPAAFKIAGKTDAAIEAMRHRCAAEVEELKAVCH